jgi:hypothetical protein
LAQKDAERVAHEAEKQKILRDTIESLFLDLTHEHWFSRKEVHSLAAGLPYLENDQLNIG